jgi:hypothetical protein
VVGFVFANFGLGRHYETGVQLLRLILSGVFDRHPGLRAIVGVERIRYSTDYPFVDTGGGQVRAGGSD